MAGMNKKWNPEGQWEFPKGEISNQERRKIIAIVTMYTVVTLFENFSYKFGGKNYKQNQVDQLG